MLLVTIKFHSFILSWNIYLNINNELLINTKLTWISHQRKDKGFVIYQKYGYGIRVAMVKSSC